MNNKTSTKNLVIGFALGVAVTASLGAALKRNSEVGRFQVSGGGDNNAYVVDTVTGKVWSRRSLATKHGAEFALPKAQEKMF